MKRRWFVLLTILVIGALSFPLAGCGGGGGGGGGGVVTPNNWDAMSWDSGTWQ